MRSRYTLSSFHRVFFFLVGLLFPLQNVTSLAQDGVYRFDLPTEPPYYRVRYEASTQSGELVYPVSYTVWIPPNVKALRGVVVHQHGCGEGSCKSGQTGAHDLHWQALAKKHDCALLSPVVEQPDKADCQMWCDPRNGSDKAFQRALQDLAILTQHSELATVPWALWGHSGGGHWAGGMVFLHPERVVAAWLRSGVPPNAGDSSHPKGWSVSQEALTVPIVCNLGTKEGFTDKTDRFAKVWEGVEKYFLAMRSRGAPIGLAIDPRSSHECGNQRYMAILWLDACLTARLPENNNAPLRAMPQTAAWLAPMPTAEDPIPTPTPQSMFAGAKETSTWFPNESIAKAWQSYSLNTEIEDTTPPPAPTNVRVLQNEIIWDAEADLESGIAYFVIERDGQEIGRVPDQPKNPFGRPLFQNNSYSDTPTQPLALMRYTDPKPVDGATHQYRVLSVNTVGLRSK